MKIINLKQGTPEWEEFRRSKIGSSDTPIICGVSPYKSSSQLWKEKMGFETTFHTYAMDRGKMEEERLRPLLCDLYQADLQPLVGQDEEHEWMIASFDGIDQQKGIMVEIKYTNEDNYARIVNSKEYPIHYIYQIQHALFVCKLEKAFLCLSNGKQWIPHEVIACPDIQEEIIRKGEEFYSCLKNWEKPKGDYIDRPDLMERMAERASISEGIEMLMERRDMIDESLQMDSNGISFQSGPYRYTKSTFKGAIDYKSIPELSSVDLEKYRKPSYDKWVFYRPRKDESQE